MSCFVLSYDWSKINSEKLDWMDCVDDWLHVMPGMMLLLSAADARTIAKEVRTIAPDLQFVVAEVDPSKKDGYLPRVAWEFLNRQIQTSIDA